MDDNLIKGNFKVKNEVKNKAQERKSSELEKTFESSAFEKLGGSIAFVKKSTNFVWKGEEAKK